MSLFQKAERKARKAKIALMGPSGSGKTLGALLFARGLVGPARKIAVIDTENASSSMYADRKDDWKIVGDFDVANMHSPFLVSKYVAAINDAANAGYDALIVDSISHAWAGEGGVLEQKTAIDARNPKSNTFTNWSKVTPDQNLLLSTIIQAPIHLIVTFRVKTEYSMETNDHGKITPKKVGLAAIQKDGMEYEFDVVLNVDADHIATSSKDRTGLFDGRSLKINTVAGQKLGEWLAGS